ncbi:uncharacterized protein METZ01_LOCUS328438 [marine metagenome]|uniref:Uncharacterized protein n=1 Tax=marine metagenome TaxID=408172 RepID=A0A382PQI0_9ZZZZ
MAVIVNPVTFPGQDIYSVKDTKVKKIVAVGFDNKMDAKDKRNELSKDIWEKWKKKDEKDRGPKPLPYIVVKGEDHPKHRLYTRNGEKN